MAKVKTTSARKKRITTSDPKLPKQATLPPLRVAPPADEPVSSTLETLQAKHRLLTTVIESIPDFIYVKDLQGRYVFLNSAVAQAVGKPVTELIGQDDFAFFAPEFARQLQAEDQNVLCSGKMKVYEKEYVFPSKTSSLLTIKNICQDAQGRVIGVVGISRDITERKRSEAALQQSEEKLQALLNHSPVAIALTDFEGKITYINHTFEHWFGYRHEEIQRIEQWYQFAYPDPKYRQSIVGPWETSVQQARQHGTPMPTMEVAIQCKDGSTRQVMGMTTIITGQLMVIFNDITRQKQAEAASRELTQQLLLSQDQERRRIARELHDATAQGLVGLLLILSSLKHRVAALDPEGGKMLDESMLLTKQSIDEVRTLSFLLHPPQLEHFGLVGAIRDMAEEFGRRSNLKMVLDLPPNRLRLPREYELTFFRILQEALLNIHRHAESKSAMVKLVRNKTEIRLEVQDQGHGMPMALGGDDKMMAAYRGVGISGMRERLRHLGGRLEIETGENGTTVIAVLPNP
ncbi:MAG: PAS domain S-box protein [Verrucomicrobiota bacterium]